MKRILFMGPLPEPVTGHSLACRVLLDALQGSYAIDVVDLSKKALVSGVDSASRILDVIKALMKVAAWRHRSDISYLTISESLAGNLKDLVIYLLLFRRLNKMVLHLHGGSIKKDVFDRNPLLRLANKFFLRRIGKVIILGETHRSIFSGMVADSNVCIVKNFAEDFLFSSPSLISQKFSTSGPVRVLFLSNLISGKGYDLLVQAYEALPPSAKEKICIDFAGSFENDRDRAAFFARIKHNPYVTYHGIVRGNSKKALLDSAHVFCLPTILSEGQPISILEAYAAGCTVITTNCGGIPDIFTPGVNGYGIEPGSQQSLSQALEMVIANPDQIREFALFNHGRATERYRAEDYSHSITSILDDVSAGGNLCSPAH